jgi:lysophospholipase L1-like esterase
MMQCVATYRAHGQEPAPQGDMPERLIKGMEAFETWRTSRIPTWMDDFGELKRYAAANAALKAPATGERRVVFFGDSITDGWHLDESFPGRGYINRGIGGQTTPQMLVRFRADVLALQPSVVVILAGTNDIAGNTGPMDDGTIEGNYQSMAELARAHGIAVIFASVTPVHNYNPGSITLFATRPAARILALNRWLKEYCATHGCLYLNYFAAMVDEHGSMRREYSQDGLHPNAAGYAVMAPLAQAAIDQALEGNAKTGDRNSGSGRAQ